MQLDPLEAYTLLSVIGKGAYAKVVLVRKRSTGQLYALKSMKKKYIEQKQQSQRVMTQRNILTEIDNPFLIKIHASFQNEAKLYLVLEYCPGGELFGLLKKRKRLSEANARFYAAQIVLALEYLHSRNIIYRDLKPENILLGKDGYVKLTDFGLSRSNILGDYQAFSLCGTPEYMAPEVIRKEGHGRAVDWWCLGCLLYQLVHGLPPYYAKNRGHLYDMIVETEPEYNKQWSKNFRDLLAKLLLKSPEERMKHVPTLKEHPWFAVLNWKDLTARTLKPPFVPLLDGDCDVSNFATQFTKCSVNSQGGDSVEEYDAFEGFSFKRSNSSPVLKPLQLLLEPDTEEEFTLSTEPVA